MCWLKNSVPARVQDNCCVSGVRGAGVVEPRNTAEESSIDRFGGDYKNFWLKGGEGDEACKAACTEDNKCRAWTYARPGYVGKDAHCFLKKDEGDEACKAACTDDNKCRAWTYARPGYIGRQAHCFLKKEIKPPRHKAGFTSGVVR